MRSFFLGSGEEGSAHSPYLAARRTWNDHVARLVSARTIWQAVGLISLMIALSSVGGLIHLSSRSQLIPYVVQVDKVGQVLAVDRADRMAPASEAVIEEQLTRFITLSRRVTTDISLQRNAIFGVFSMLSNGDPAVAKMAEYLDGTAEQSPFARAKSETVTTEVKSILQQSDSSFQVDWTETVYARSGARKDQYSMRAIVSVYQSDRKFVDEEELRSNPLGIYIRDFDWNRRHKREAAQ